ncbi:centromere protein Q isoform X1 [Centrocercus urophasianus]|uniref:centromere protein Q isoform X1 n=2 Tax=Centrocercus urophasianus TaxID=9002 RepID=UPI001C6533B2|nr:centromere protein Q isoform X1 [Centrocercus urophasianus]
MRVERQCACAYSLPVPALLREGRWLPMRMRRFARGTMKRYHASSGKRGEAADGGTAKRPTKSHNLQGPTSQKKGTGGKGNKHHQKKKHVTQAVRRKDEEHEDSSSSAGEKGHSKKVKLSSAKLGSWQPLSESSRKFLEGVMDSGILSILCQQSKGKEDVQKHLNLLKERVLRVFKTLKVPSGKLSNLSNVLRFQVAQKQMLEMNETALVQLQEEINEAEKSAEHTEETILRLQHNIEVLKGQLEEEEKKAGKLFREGDTKELHLPELPKCSLQASTLQEEILMVENQKGLLEDMNTIQQSADMRNMLTFIEKIYEKVDFV